MSEIIKFYETKYNPNRLIVQWNLGNTCNYSCEYCPSILHRGDRDWVELELIKNTLLKIKDQYKDKEIKVEFLGGEITLYRHFIDLMIFCKENSFKNMIFTNASRTFRHWEDVIPHLDEILLTFHPHTTNKDHFEKVIKLCIDNNVNFFVHTAMTKDLFWDTAKYARYLYDKYKIYISMTLMMDKENKKNYNGYFYDYSEEEIAFVRKYDRGAEKYTVEYANGESQKVSLNDVKDLKLNQFKGFTCGTDNSLINIDAFGNATTSLCRQRKKINIYQDNIEDLFSEHICRSQTCENPSDLRVIKIHR